MSRMSDLVSDIQDEIERGELAFSEIAIKFSVPTSWVDEAYDMLQEQYAEEDARPGPDYDDSWNDIEYDME
jgi:hypothetical protein